MSSWNMKLRNGLVQLRLAWHLAKTTKNSNHKWSSWGDDVIQCKHWFVTISWCSRCEEVVDSSLRRKAEPIRNFSVSLSSFSLPILHLLVKFPHSLILHCAFSSWENRFVSQQYGAVRKFIYSLSCIKVWIEIATKLNSTTVCRPPGLPVCTRR